jgi:hypothetical protein
MGGKGMPANVAGMAVATGKPCTPGCLIQFAKMTISTIYSIS